MLQLRQRQYPSKRTRDSNGQAMLPKIPHKLAKAKRGVSNRKSCLKKTTSSGSTKQLWETNCLPHIAPSSHKEKSCNNGSRPKECYSEIPSEMQRSCSSTPECNVEKPCRQDKCKRVSDDLWAYFANRVIHRNIAQRTNTFS